MGKPKRKQVTTLQAHRQKQQAAINETSAVLAADGQPEPSPEFEFYAPIVYEPAWELELGDVDRNYALLQTDCKDAAFPSIVSNPEEPILFLGKPIYEAFMEIAKYSAKIKKEVAAYFLYVPLNDFSPHWEAIGWFMTGQEASAAEVSMLGDDFPRYMEYLRETYPELMNRARLGHMHVHPNMGVFDSATDKNQQFSKDELALNTGERFFMVINEKKEIKAKYIQYAPVQFEKDKITVGISYNNPEYLEYDVATERKQIQEMVDNLVIKKTYQTKQVYNNPHHYQQGYGYYAYNQRRPSPAPKPIPKQQKPEEDDSIADYFRTRQEHHVTATYEPFSPDTDEPVYLESVLDDSILKSLVYPEGGLSERYNNLQEYMQERHTTAYRRLVRTTMERYAEALQYAAMVELAVRSDDLVAAVPKDPIPGKEMMEIWMKFSDAGVDYGALQTIAGTLAAIHKIITTDKKGFEVVLPAGLTYAQQVQNLCIEICDSAAIALHMTLNYKWEEDTVSDVLEYVYDKNLVRCEEADLVFAILDATDSPETDPLVQSNKIAIYFHSIDMELLLNFGS